ncbi:imidazole glycerol phosphate synthase amidotransferase subunit [Liquorilactobacillus sucicola DSM 21376 = JCM 15457]|uniref:Imidazole glycerol phosphate synthase subunit HisH n=1 Tax=Liquorilactobacillus sucicola DSM 21376 = JCM 15457 TaxID=1423806 RepID=A0A023CZZ9_9LACO|nr:imidazole glycerol phosphate synthase subunit HisH [Liquorilactobacillus sucicola]KRN06419.1 imidazole glycerol phosphate synthase amidotransferase subunit [Liquorilactobacillus sucicola DSM 21376 = JCM 15457]GAJ27452.1 imidazole glycerol phosphate synthase amidotransferase subunit [Liquorilactobacillus sucicola DSM 21376 = JCM 15457]
MITLVDYDAGNTYNLQKAFAYLGVETNLTDDQDELLASEAIVLPGVGAFQSAMTVLKAKKLDTTLQKAATAGIPLLGICLGMQLLFDTSSEYGITEGLHLIPGNIIELPAKKGFKIPQMGWNQNNLLQPDSEFSLLEDEYTYFVHSYYAKCDPKYVVSEVEYSVNVPAVVQNKNVFGMQFHPEKSGHIGLEILKTFKERVVVK